MPVRSLRRRVDRVRLQATPEPVGRIVIVYPDSWPLEEQAAYHAAKAANDWPLQADIIERVTGERPVYPVPGWSPGRQPAIIEIVTRDDGR